MSALKVLLILFGLPLLLWLAYNIIGLGLLLLRLLGGLVWARGRGAAQNTAGSDHAAGERSGGAQRPEETP